MNHEAHAWWNFGYAGLFACVFLEQIGVPIPAFPALFAAGALVTTGELHLPNCLIVAVAAALLADLIWYGIGWVRGHHVLNLMCRLSWRPDTCVGKTKSVFSQHGTKTLLFSKFIPGLSTLAPPLAGMTQVPLLRFVCYDGAGSLLWAMVPLVFGAYLQARLTTILSATHSMIPYLPWIAGFLIIAVLIWRYANRSQYLKVLRESRLGAISPEQLKSVLDQGQDVARVDIRDEISARSTPATLPNAWWLPYTKLKEWISDLPRNKPIFVFCDCPEDQAAVAAVDVLRHHGINQARALHGGLDAWIAKGFKTSEIDFSTSSLKPV